MAHIFDGKKIAIEKETEIEQEVKKLKEKGVVPKLVSILVGENKESQLLLKLKKEAAERIGMKLEIKTFQANKSVSQLIKFIEELNNDNSLNGIMVQLPLPKDFSKKDREKIIQAIASEKDVDGMRDNSPYLTPVVGAVLKVIKEASSYIARPPLKARPCKVVVVGAKGFVGRKISRVLKKNGYEVKGVDVETKNLKVKTKTADILTSVAGEPGLITGDMVGRDAIVIDVGYPKGDVNFDQVAQKASFITPVPGGIGPVTISFLLENLVNAAY